MTQPELDFNGDTWKLLWEFDLGTRHIQVFQDTFEVLRLESQPRVMKKRKRLIGQDANLHGGSR